MQRCTLTVNEKAFYRSLSRVRPALSSLAAGPAVAPYSQVRMSVFIDLSTAIERSESAPGLANLRLFTRRLRTPPEDASKRTVARDDAGVARGRHRAAAGNNAQ
jgi:hypothetical protein